MNRAREKQKSRDKDRRDLEDGKLTVSELNARNSHVRGTIDWKHYEKRT